MLKVIRENSLNIPVNTILHDIQFNDQIDTQTGYWISECYYVYKQNNKLYSYTPHQLKEISNCTINCIHVTGAILEEGDYYWKVFVSEQKVKYHKLEFDGKKHTDALLYKPYRDIVHANTNNTPDCYRYKSLKEAEDICDKLTKQKG